MCSITSDIQFYCIEIKVGEVPILYLFFIGPFSAILQRKFKGVLLFTPISVVKSYCTKTYRYS